MVFQSWSLDKRLLLSCLQMTCIHAILLIHMHMQIAKQCQNKKNDTRRIDMEKRRIFFEETRYLKEVKAMNWYRPMLSTNTHIYTKTDSYLVIHVEHGHRFEELSRISAHIKPMLKHRDKPRQTYKMPVYTSCKFLQIKNLN